MNVDTRLVVFTIVNESIIVFVIFDYAKKDLCLFNKQQSFLK